MKQADVRLREPTDGVPNRLPPAGGSRLEQGAVYIDLAAAGLAEIKATGNIEADPGNLCVLKSEMDYPLWNRLIGDADPARTGAANP